MRSIAGHHSAAWNDRVCLPAEGRRSGAIASRCRTTSRFDSDPRQLEIAVAAGYSSFRGVPSAVVSRAFRGAARRPTNGIHEVTGSIPVSRVGGCRPSVPPGLFRVHCSSRPRGTVRAEARNRDVRIEEVHVRDLSDEPHALQVRLEERLVNRAISSRPRRRQFALLRERRGEALARLASQPSIIRRCSAHTSSWSDLETGLSWFTSAVLTKRATSADSYSPRCRTGRPWRPPDSGVSSL
jgi:hypothetical protein